jgi:hypothetical protein
MSVFRVEEAIKNGMIIATCSSRCFEAIDREHKGVSDNEAAKLIQREFSGFKDFTAITADALRRRLPEARKRIQRLRRKMSAPTPGLGQLANLAAPPF